MKTFLAMVSTSRRGLNGSPSLAGSLSQAPFAIRSVTGWILFSKTWASIS